MGQLLSIGSIVVVDKENDNKLMILGYFPYDIEDKHLYTYSGTFYPTGIVNENSIVMFNEDSIEEVVFNGFKNEDGEELLNDLSEIRDGMMQKSLLHNFFNTDER